MLGLVDEPVEDVVDLLAYVGSEPEELAVNPVQSRLEEVPLPWVLRVEQIQQLQYELVVDVALGDRRLEIRRLEQTQEELVDELEVGPGYLERRLVLLRVELRAVGVRRGRQSAEQVHRELWVCRQREQCA